MSGASSSSSPMRIGELEQRVERPARIALRNARLPRLAAPIGTLVNHAAGEHDDLGIEDVGERTQARAEREAGVVDDGNGALVTGAAACAGNALGRGGLDMPHVTSSPVDTPSLPRYGDFSRPYSVSGPFPACTDNRPFARLLTSGYTERNILLINFHCALLY